MELKCLTVILGRRIKRIREFALFYDYDRAYFDAIDEAERVGKHL